MSATHATSPIEVRYKAIWVQDTKMFDLASDTLYGTMISVDCEFDNEDSIPSLGLVQIATRLQDGVAVFLFQPSLPAFGQTMQAILSNAALIASWGSEGDMMMLLKAGALPIRMTWHDVQKVVSGEGPPVGLDTYGTETLGVSKYQLKDTWRMRWSGPLSQEMIDYAARDAYLTLLAGERNEGRLSREAHEIDRLALALQLVWSLEGSLRRERRRGRQTLERLNEAQAESATAISAREVVVPPAQELGTYARPMTLRELADRLPSQEPAPALPRLTDHPGSQIHAESELHAGFEIQLEPAKQQPPLMAVNEFFAKRGMMPSQLERKIIYFNAYMPDSGVQVWRAELPANAYPGYAKRLVIGRYFKQKKDAEWSILGTLMSILLEGEHRLSK